MYINQSINVLVFSDYWFSMSKKCYQFVFLVVIINSLWLHANNDFGCIYW